jgi:hypothetical protein
MDKYDYVFMRRADVGGQIILRFATFYERAVFLMANSTRAACSTLTWRFMITGKRAFPSKQRL